MTGKSSVRKRLYDALKGRVLDWLGPRLGGWLARMAEFGFLLPDILVLLGRLLLDKRAPRRLRIKLGMILAYLASPFDLIPESVLGPLGLADDLVLVAFALERVFEEVEEDVLAELWSGRPEHLETLRELAALAGGIFSGRLAGRLRDWYEKENVPGVEIPSGRMELVSEEEDSEEERVARLRASGL